MSENNALWNVRTVYYSWERKYLMLLSLCFLIITTHIWFSLSSVIRSHSFHWSENKKYCCMSWKHSWLAMQIMKHRHLMLGRGGKDEKVNKVTNNLKSVKCKTPAFSSRCNITALNLSYQAVEMHGREQLNTVQEPCRECRDQRIYTFFYVIIDWLMRVFSLWESLFKDPICDPNMWLKTHTHTWKYKSSATEIINSCTVWHLLLAVVKELTIRLVMVCG